MCIRDSTTDDIIHIDSLVDTHQEGLKAAVALHHRQELLALYVHEDTCMPAYIMYRKPHLCL